MFSKTNLKPLDVETLSSLGARAMKPGYEPGMKITYDPMSKRVIVAFRGRITVLPDPCESEEEGHAAGESYCRRLGWKPDDPGKASRKFRSLW